MRTKIRGERAPVLEIALLLVAALMLTVIVGATVWAYSTGRVRPGSGAPPGDRLPVDTDTAAMFSDLGALRALTADSEPAVVVIFPVFAYDPNDVAFREELVAKKTALRSLVASWFRGKTRSELTRMGDSGVKAEILERINGILETGSVSRIYFTEYTVLD